jgi:hypothetical protein
MEEYRPEGQPTPGGAKKSGEIREYIIGGSILVGLGLLFLLHSLGILRLSYSWPFILIVVGASLLIAALRK